MVWVLAALSLGLWGLGVAASYQLGGFIHVLLATAIVLLLARVAQNRRGIQCPTVASRISKRSRRA